MVVAKCKTLTDISLDKTLLLKLSAAGLLYPNPAAPSKNS